jgi:hypothetical protein
VVEVEQLEQEPLVREDLELQVFQVDLQVEAVLELQELQIQVEVVVLIIME